MFHDVSHYPIECAAIVLVNGDLNRMGVVKWIMSRMGDDIHQNKQIKNLLFVINIQIINADGE